MQLTYNGAEHRPRDRHAALQPHRAQVRHEALPGPHDRRLRGSAGQSLGAFAVQGLKLEVFGDANDYVGKGLSGGTIVVRPSPHLHAVAGVNAIIGNTVLYGATAGKLFAAGQAGERFAVRNSGATCGGRGLRLQRLRVHDRRHGGDPRRRMSATISAAGMTGGMAWA
jgi:glutamate synthase (NADPH/NADH) large chain